MPARPPRMCAFAGCRRLVQGRSYCAEHQALIDAKRAAREAETHKAYNQKRPVSDNFYSTRRWLETRRRHLALHPLCLDCTTAGRVTPGVVVDHIKPRKVFPELELEPSNLRTLCRACDNRRRRDMTGRT
ncbi:HNH endonuclease [Pseudomonas sp. RIT-PI-AD]|uniref:HNH endonuclease n=1 Tax=Pseudomonas sp. RIT-PI-AD TaxID=3035294 RepID=UPI0021D8601C|nr:HNH endonuclease [Pseudomonas sp. RIT-PI-AD]